MIPQEIIRKKRDKHSLTEEEIKIFVSGLTDQSFSDEQIAAMSMAIFCNGMTAEETVWLTHAMKNSGDTLNWENITDSDLVCDKHSTGGVGDKTSLLLAPILAACGLFVPMISGRGLGHTGGTLDKFDSIPGYNTQPDTDTFTKVVKQIGCAIIGQTSNLAPADKKLYSIRDVVGTVESLPLITSSILSKKINQKLYEGIYCMYSGPNFETPAEIQALKVIGGNAVGMSTVPEVLVANHCGIPVVAISVITNLAAGMNKTKLSHKETLENAALAESNILNLIKNFINDINLDDTSGNN